MTIDEFRSKVDAGISDKDYSVIEYVYTWHPSIHNVNGKDQVAMLYKTFGMRIFQDMLNTAKAAEVLDKEISSVHQKCALLKDIEEQFKSGLLTPGDVMNRLL